MTDDVADRMLRAVVRLGADYARLVDNRDATRWSELFAPDGYLDLGDRRIEGRAALEKFAADSPAGVHLQGLPSITVHDDGMTCQASFVFVSTANGTVIAGWYTDELAWDGERLVFKVRHIDRRAKAILTST